jgi:hypothetical protein
MGSPAFLEATMRGSLLWMAALAFLTARAVGGEPQPGAGWFGVFPPGPVNYDHRFLAPAVADGKEPTAYRQEVQYDWLGNDFRQAKATLARDPDFKTKYAPDALKQQGAVEVVVGKKSGWLLPTRGAGIQQERDLIVPVGTEKAVIVTGIGHFGDQEAIQLAASFDLAKVEDALSKPPRNEFKREKGMFCALPKDASWQDVIDWAAYPDRTVVNDKRIEGAEYDLADSGAIHLVLKDGKLAGVTYTDKDGKTEDLLK